MTPPAWEPLRRRVREVLSQPATDAVVVALVLASVVLLMVELSLPLDSVAGRIAAWSGDVLTGLFAGELALRWWVARRTATFLRQYWIDLLAVVPVARTARLFRLVRVLRLVRAGVAMNRRVLWRYTSQADNVHQLTLLATLATAAVVAGTAALVTAESGLLHAWDEAAWYALYLFVGGEPIGPAPETTAGRVTTLGLMLGGMTIFGMFVGTVSAAMVTRMVKGWDVRDSDFEDLDGHVVVCGWNRSGPTLLQELVVADPRARVVLVCEGERPEDLPLDVLHPDQFFFHQGDYTRVDVLTHVGVPRARKAVLLTDGVVPRSDQDRDARTVLAALTIERLRPGIYTVAEVVSADTARHLEHAGVEEVVVGDWYAGVILGSAAANPGLVDVLDEILSHTYGNVFHTLELPPAWVGWTLRQARCELHDRWEATLVSVHAGRERLVNPPGDRTLAVGETLVVLARHRPQLP
ncbi:MAG: NAD-binding protein [Alphaproteobacteria bacterium]|nr:NAD-binding protein [Alphaproteobacteria bacterium]